MFSEEPVVQVQQASIEIKGRSILKDISFTVQKGEFCYVIGRTGSGKSSLLKMLYGELAPVQGEVKVAGYDVKNIKKSELPYLRRKLGIVFQDFQLLPDRNVSENIEFALRATGWTDTVKIKNKISEVLMMVGLSARALSYPHEISGGEQQRVVIARALINDPVLIIADEPTGNLDPEVSKEIIQILLNIHKMGTAVMLATHDYSILKRNPFKTLECRTGELIQHSQDYIAQKSWD